MQNDRCIQIYKYCSLAGEHGRQAIEHAILKSQLYWQSPLKFNDPFDCWPVLYYGDNAIQRSKFIARAAAQVSSGQSRVARRKHRSDIQKVPIAQMEARIRENWIEWLSSSAVTCFSEISDHPLMWGHYADSHKGVCLIFDEIANLQSQWFAFPVEYRNARPKVNFTRFNDNAGQMKLALLAKSEHWRYECEQRMIDWRGQAGYRDFPPKQLKGIILGAKISKDDEEFVRGLLEKRSDLQVFRAEIDATEFKLNVLPA